MATLYIEEHDNILKDKNGNVVQATSGTVTEQKVTVGASSAQSSAVNSATKFLVIVTDTACQYETGSNPTADTNSRFLPANVFRVIQVDSGDKIAVIEQQ